MLDSPQHSRLMDAVRFVAVLALVPYVGWLVFAYRYHFLDGVNLVVHEAGHVVFMPLGEVPGSRNYVLPRETKPSASQRDLRGAGRMC